MFVYSMTSEFFPESARIWIGLGEVHEKQGDSESAIRAYEKAVELDPTGEAGREASKRLSALKQKQ
ncbi:MAG: tetratricopeptide repeat protein [Bacteroidetes bacterium]|nr:MAG: tetratricopeptide repeat protein [Bacteroidota bacterium]